MILERREFLKLLGLAAGTAGLGGCGRGWLVPDNLVELARRGPGLESHIQTICGLCEGGCGLTVRLVDDLPVGLKGNPNHPLNRGGLCPVGQAGLDVLYSPDRLQAPLRRHEGGGFEATDWETALEAIGGRLAELRFADQGHRAALLVGSPDELFFDLARSFAQALGSPNIARLGESGVVPYGLSQGLEKEPGFDYAETDLALTFGLDLFEDGPAPLHVIAAMVGDRPAGQRAAMIHVGTRLSPTASKAEERLVVRPGSYAALALGVGHVLVREGRYDHEFVAEHTFGFDDWTDERGQQRMGFRRLLLERYYPERAAQLCGSDAASIIRVARRFAEASHPVAIVGGEAARETNATWTALAVQALNALMGAFDRPGGVVLPAPIPLGPLPTVSDPATDDGASVFVAAGDGSSLLGVDPVEALADAVLSGSHQIDVLIVAGCDPARESPVWERLSEALERIPMVVALASFHDGITEHADFVLPTPVPLEDWRAATTPASVPFSVLGIAKPVVEPFFESRHAADVLLDLAQRSSTGQGSGMPWASYETYLEDRLEQLAVSGEGAIVTGSFEEDWQHFLEERGWRFQEQKRPEEFWHDLTQQAGWWNPVQSRDDWPRLFRTPSGRYEFFSQSLERHLRAAGAKAGGVAVDDDDALQHGAHAIGLTVDGDEACLPHYEPVVEIAEGELALIPFRPITARGELGTASRMLMEMFGYPVLSGWETWAELSADTAHAFDVDDGDLVSLESVRSSIEAVVRVTPGGAADVVHVPFGLGRSNGPEGAKIGSNPVDLMPLARDPISGSLALNSTRVRLRLVRRRQHGGPAPRHGEHTT